MYAQHFGLKQAPFSIAPDPRYLYMSERHREALAHLLYGVRGEGGFVVLTGEIGAGKTTVCRCFLEQVPERCNVAYIFNPKLSVEELLRTICAEFHVEPPREGPAAATVKDYVDALNAHLLRAHAAGQNSVLIIDEAQNLSADVLEQLRLLTNLETNERKLLQIVLIGQPELRAALARPQMQQLAQRVIARYHLEALSETETAHYVGHRMAIAGLVGEVPFDRGALRRLYRHSRGVPRRINLLADRALLGAYAQGRTRIDAAAVDAAAKEVFDEAPRAQAERAVPRLAWVGLGAVAGAAIVGAALLLGRGDSLVADDAAAAVAPPAGSATLPPGLPQDSGSAAGADRAAVPTDRGTAPAGRGAAATDRGTAAMDRGVAPAGLGTAAASAAPVLAAAAAAVGAPASDAASPIAMAPSGEAAPRVATAPASEAASPGATGAGSKARSPGAVGAARTAAAPFDLATGFESLVGAEGAAWRELARAWNLDLGGGDPCLAARRHQVQCFRTARSTLALIRQLDRPVVLTLRDAYDRAAFAMLAGLSADSATLVIEGVPRTVPLLALADYWRGEFGTFWRAPPQYAGAISDRRGGAAAQWLARQLAAARGESPPTGAPFDDAALRDWIHAFQLTQGLPSDGVAGPVTLMALNRAVGIDEPRLAER
jgi:general secretion pathway protein A